MHLSRFTDYTLRTLTYLARHPDRLVTIAEIAGANSLSSNHLMKVVQHLAAEGDIVTMRGQHGGVRLARPPRTIKLGQVIRRSEHTIELLPWHEEGLDGTEPLRHIVARALETFLSVLDAHTVADLVTDAE